MYKSIVLVTAVLIAACGTGSSGSNPSTDQGGGNLPGAGPNVPTIPVGALQTLPADINEVKVVLNTTQTVYSFVCSGFDSDGACIPVACSGTNPCAAGQTCSPTNECLSPNEVPTILYVKNLTAPPYDFPVPCDGRGYIAEVYVTTTPTASAGARALVEWYVSPKFTMPNTTGVTCTPPAIVWPAQDLGAPVVHNPLTPVYVAGFDPKFSTFPLTLTGLSSPWATNGGTGWTVTYGGQVGATTYNGATATMPAPPASSAGSALSVTTMFALDNARLLPAEKVAGSEKPWRVTRTPSVAAGPIPVSIGNVPPP